MKTFRHITMTLATLAVLAAFSGCASYYPGLKQELGNKAASDDASIRRAYPVTPVQLAEVVEYSIRNNGFTKIRREETADGTVIASHLTQQVLFFKVESPLGALVRPLPAGGSEVVVVSKNREKPEDMLGWVSDSFKANRKFAEWLKPGAGSAVARTAVKPAVAGEILNVAVSDFTADGVSASDASVTANLLRNALVNTGAFNVVEKTRMDAILSEQAFQQAGCTEQDCAVKLGKLLNVRRMFIGSCGKLMGEFMVSVRVVDVESGKITFAEDVKGESAGHLKDGIKSLADRLASSKI